MDIRIIASAILLCLAGHGATAQEAVDLELVLAIDASGSVSDAEWRLQLDGYAAAFQDPRIEAAISSGPHGRIGVAVVVWADETRESPWFVLASPADSEQFASFIQATRRRVFGGTGIGAGIAVAIGMLDRNALTAARQVIDVSGDGRETPPHESVVLIGEANAMARARGVIVNGLAILNEDSGLERWYLNNVISGPGSFVMTAADYEDFREAIVRKLIREIEHRERMSLR